MNKRGFLATLAAMCVAPFAVKANPSSVDLSFAPFPESMRRRFETAWLNSNWRPVADLEPIPDDDRDHVWEAPHEHDAYVEFRIGEWRQAFRVCGSDDPVECVKSMLKPDSLLTDTIEQELTYPDSVLHKIRAESKAAVYKDLAERSVRILPR